MAVQLTGWRGGKDGGSADLTEWGKDGGSADLVGCEQEGVALLTSMRRKMGGSGVLLDRQMRC